MDHLAEGFRGGALAPAAMPWRSAASRSLPKAAKIISRFHDCPPSKRGHDTSPLYQGDVARHRIGIVCISGRPETGLVAYHLRKTAMSSSVRPRPDII